MRTHTNIIDDKILAKDILYRFKKKNKFNDNEWKKFCKHYAGRNISAVIWCLKKENDKMTTRIVGCIREELAIQAAN